MATFKRFEEMHSWQSARELVRLVYEITKQLDFNRDFALRDQIRRAVISVMSNIAEGFGTGSVREEDASYTLDIPDSHLKADL